METPTHNTERAIVNDSTHQIPEPCLRLVVSNPECKVDRYFCDEISAPQLYVVETSPDNIAKGWMRQGKYRLGHLLGIW